MLLRSTKQIETLPACLVSIAASQFDIQILWAASESSSLDPSFCNEWTLCVCVCCRQHHCNLLVHITPVSPSHSWPLHVCLHESMHALKRDLLKNFPQKKLLQVRNFSASGFFKSAWTTHVISWFCCILLSKLSFNQLIFCCWKLLLFVSVILYLFKLWWVLFCFTAPHFGT